MKSALATGSFAFFLLAACGGKPSPEAKAPEPAPPAKSEEPAEEPAKAEEKKAPEPLEVKIEAKSGSKLAGTARFEAVEGGVKVTLHVTGVGKGHHGAHIHQKADCSSADGKSAGDHFNPDSHDHGMPPGEKRHLGDLGNLEIA